MDAPYAARKPRRLLQFHLTTYLALVVLTGGFVGMQMAWRTHSDLFESSDSRSFIVEYGWPFVWRRQWVVYGNNDIPGNAALLEKARELGVAFDESAAAELDLPSEPGWIVARFPSKIRVAGIVTNVVVAVIGLGFVTWFLERRARLN